MKTRNLFGKGYFLPQTETRRNSTVTIFDSTRAPHHIIRNSEVVFESTEFGFAPYDRVAWFADFDKTVFLLDFAKMQVNVYLNRCEKRGAGTETKFILGQMQGGDSTAIYRELRQGANKPICKEDLVQECAVVLMENIARWDVDIPASYYNMRICFTSPIWTDPAEIWKSGPKAGQLKELTVWTMCQRALDKALYKARTKDAFCTSWESFTTASGIDIDIKKNANFETLFNMKCDLFAGAQTMEERDHNATVYSFLREFVEWAEHMADADAKYNKIDRRTLTTDAAHIVKCIVMGYCFGQTASGRDIRNFSELAKITNNTPQALNNFVKRVFKPLFKMYCREHDNADLIEFLRKFKADTRELLLMEN